jgi:hypothetical protein
VVADQKSGLTTMEFSSGEFSVYAVVETVVPRLTVTFSNGASENPVMYVKAADTDEELKGIVYDPGVEGLAANEVFRGWTTESNYTADTTLMDIDQVRADAKSRAAALGDADGDVTYYAAIFKQYTVSYLGEAGISLGSATVEVPRSET